MRSGEWVMGNGECGISVKGRSPYDRCLYIPHSALRIPHSVTQKPAPANRSGLLMRSWRRPTLPRPRSRSTIGADRLNDRVRDGNGCGPVALVASKRCLPTDKRVRGAEDPSETEERSSLTGN